jgi:DNA-binding response OmpR family regulator
MTRILLAEDDPGVLVLFEEVLLIAGYHVDTAETFQVADKLLASREYDLLLTDGKLSDGSGLMLADTAKAKGITALIVTGFFPELDRKPGIDLNNYVVLRKPLTPTDLLAAVSGAIGDGTSNVTSASRVAVPIPCEAYPEITICRSWVAELETGAIGLLLETREQGTVALPLSLEAIDILRRDLAQAETLLRREVAQPSQRKALNHTQG